MRVVAGPVVDLKLDLYLQLPDDVSSDGGWLVGRNVVLLPAPPHHVVQHRSRPPPQTPTRLYSIGDITFSSIVRIMFGSYLQTSVLLILPAPTKLSV